MAGERGAAEPTRYALLGLLEKRRSYGYELTQRFETGTALGEIVRLAASHLYALLAKMERDGLIEGRQEEAGARPQRRVYRLTDSGRTLLMTWLDLPVSHPRDMRIEFPLKLYIADMVHPESVPGLIERQRETLEAYIERIQSLPPPSAPGLEGSYILLIREGRIGRARAALEWLEAGSALMGGEETASRSR
jgi:DNA-binding PadR family transcriptional regulator